MTLDELLKRIGVSIVKVEKQEELGQVTLYLRVNPKLAVYWTETMTEFLLASLDKRVTWAADVSKRFYPVEEAQAVLYLWRVILSRDPRAAAEALGRAAQRALAGSVEVTSQPLVGRKNYVVDVANGKTAGAHVPKEAAGILASGMGRR